MKQMKKFNWGHGIFIFLTIFVLSMAFVAYKGFQQHNALVEEEYYPKGLVYQKQIDRIKNANALPEMIKLNELSDNIIISYPSLFKGKKVEGKIYFYRPSDDRGDYTEPMKIDSSLIQSVSTSRLMPGRYLVKMNWKMDDKEFYHEESITVVK